MAAPSTFSFHPSTLMAAGSTSPRSGFPDWAILCSVPRISKLRNATTAECETSEGHTVEVSFWLVDPPGVSYFSVNCPGLDASHFVEGMDPPPRSSAPRPPSSSSRSQCWAPPTTWSTQPVLQGDNRWCSSRTPRPDPTTNSHMPSCPAAATATPWPSSTAGGFPKMLAGCFMPMSSHLKHRLGGRTGCRCSTYPSPTNHCVVIMACPSRSLWEETRWAGLISRVVLSFFRTSLMGTLSSDLSISPSRGLSVKQCLVQVMWTLDWLRELDQCLIIERSTYNTCRLLLQLSPVSSLRSNIRSMVKCASSCNGQVEAASKAVNSCLRALDDFDLALEESQSYGSASIEGIRSKISDVLESLDNVLRIMPLALMPKERTLGEGKRGEALSETCEQPSHTKYDKCDKWQKGNPQVENCQEKKGWNRKGGGRARVWSVRLLLFIVFLLVSLIMVMPSSP